MQYPRRLNNICKFEEGSRIYLADLDRKVVVQIGEIASEILDLCSDMNLDQIVEKLQDKYGRHQIHKELEALEELGEMGLFFADEYIKQTNGKDKILVINSDQEFIKPRHPLGNPIDAFNNYYLLKALTELVELRFASVDSDTEQEVRNLIDTGDESFRLVKLPLYKQGRYMVEHYTGVLSLSTVPYLEMPLYRNSSVPVVALLYKHCARRHRSATERCVIQIRSDQAVRCVSCRCSLAIDLLSRTWIPLGSDLHNPSRDRYKPF